MQIPENVVMIDEDPELGLELYHYTDEAQHPSDASYWKGIILADGERMIAGSFPWAPTVVVEDTENKDSLPDDEVYTPFYESTLIRFYRYKGKPMASTHKRLNVMDTNSRVGTGRPFKDLIKEAIKNWDYFEEVWDVTGTGKDKILLTPPQSWEDLCAEGYCHVFLLQDWSNQITNISTLREEIIVNPEDDLYEYFSLETPKLIHAISFKTDPETGKLNPIEGFMPAKEVSGGYAYGSTQSNPEGLVDLDVSREMFEVPTAPRLTAEQAAKIIDNGGAVVGFNPTMPDVTSKYFSPLYQRMLDLAGETFNPVHRWFELMDQSPEDASEYLLFIPEHHRDKDLVYMTKIHKQYTDESARYIGDVVANRFGNIRAPVDRRIWNKASEIINNALSELNRVFARREASEKAVRAKAQDIVRRMILSKPYKEQHAIHGAIMRVTSGH